MKKVLTIAGSDCSGGAGIQADLKTMTAHKVYGMSVITALTAQNTTGVTSIMDVTPEFAGQQMDCIFTDIIPDAVKIGMVSNSGIIRVIAEKLEKYNATNLVVDPVMISTSGSKLLSEEAMDTLVSRLLPAACLITPNIPEAEALCNIKITNKNDMEKAAEVIFKQLKSAILIKGGHLTETSDDLLYTKEKMVWIRGKRIDNQNTHGTGCTLSSAIACSLAYGFSVEQSVRNAKAYVTGALNTQLDLGKGSGPLNHMWGIDMNCNLL